MHIITALEKIQYLILFVSIVLWHFFDFFRYIKMFSGIMLSVILLIECNFPYKKFGFPYIKDWHSPKNSVISDIYRMYNGVIFSLLIISFVKHSQMFIVLSIIFIIGMWVGLIGGYCFHKIFNIGQTKDILIFFTGRD